jgi:hypothetical protein
MSSITAEQVWALVKDWPREAWPDTLHYGNRAEWGQDCAAWWDDRCSVPTSDTTTAHAFVGSGLAWLARNHKQGVLWLLDEDNWACAYQRLPRQNSWGDSPLAAVSAAVLAAAKEGA